MTTYHFCYSNKGKFHVSKPRPDRMTIEKEAKRIAARFGFVVCVQAMRRTPSGEMLSPVAVYS